MRRFLGFVVLAFALAIAAVAVVHLGRAPSATAAAAVPIATSAQTDPLDLANRAPEYSILEACGKPAKMWVTKTYEGTAAEADERHFWYPKVPAEIITVAYPGMRDERMHFWMFYGASPSLSTNDMYDSADLKKRMPCTARWADASLEAERRMDARR
jgi:hypothetical protein